MNKIWQQSQSQFVQFVAGKSGIAAHGWTIWSWMVIFGEKWDPMCICHYLEGRFDAINTFRARWSELRKIRIPKRGVDVSGFLAVKSSNLNQITLSISHLKEEINSFRMVSWHLRLTQFSHFQSHLNGGLGSGIVEILETNGSDVVPWFVLK